MSSDFSRRVSDHGYLPSQSPIKDDLQQIYSRTNTRSEEILETLKGINDTQIMILGELSSLEGLSERSEEAKKVVKLVEEHFERVAKIIYTANGHDERGTRIPEGVLRFERWSKMIHTAFWNFILVSIISTFFYLYVESQKEVSDQRSIAIKEYIAKAEERMNKKLTDPPSKKETK